MTNFVAKTIESSSHTGKKIFKNIFVSLSSSIAKSNKHRAGRVWKYEWNAYRLKDPAYLHLILTICCELIKIDCVKSHK